MRSRQDSIKLLQVVLIVEEDIKGKAESESGWLYPTNDCAER